MSTSQAQPGQGERVYKAALYGACIFLPVTDFEKKIAMLLIRYTEIDPSHHEYLRTHISMPKLALRANATERGARKAMRHLEDTGAFVTEFRTNRTNLVRVVPHVLYQLEEDALAEQKAKGDPDSSESDPISSEAFGEGNDGSGGEEPWFRSRGNDGSDDLLSYELVSSKLVSGVETSALPSSASHPSSNADRQPRGSRTLRNDRNNRTPVADARPTESTSSAPSHVQLPKRTKQPKIRKPWNDTMPVGEDPSGFDDDTIEAGNDLYLEVKDRLQDWLTQNQQTADVNRLTMVLHGIYGNKCTIASAMLQSIACEDRLRWQTIDDWIKKIVLIHASDDPEHYAQKLIQFFHGKEKAVSSK